MWGHSYILHIYGMTFLTPIRQFCTWYHLACREPRLNHENLPCQTMVKEV